LYRRDKILCVSGVHVVEVLDLTRNVSADKNSDECRRKVRVVPSCSEQTLQIGLEQLIGPEVGSIFALYTVSGLAIPRATGFFSEN